MIKRIKTIVSQSSNFHSLTGNMVYALFSMSLFLVMVRVLDKELYGRWVIFITVVSLLDMLRLGLAGTGAIRSITTSTGLDQHRHIAASYHLGLFTTLGLAAVFIPLYFVLQPFFSDSYYLPVLLFYPFLGMANLPHFQAATYSQGLINFKRVLIIRSAVGILNFLFIGSYIFFFDEKLSGIIIAYGLADLAVSLPIMLMKWDGRQYFKHFHRESLRSLVNFGKYSTASFVGSNLLRSSDTIIISLSSVMGAPAVAIYAIPLKFVELIEIPLRSFTATAFPKLSAALQQGSQQFVKVLSMYLAYSFLLLAPAIIVLLAAPMFFLQILGGSEYADSIILQRNILYLVLLYILLLPFDRYSGMALFALNKPELNFYKIVFMLFTNILFDLIAVFVFNSLQMVAMATVIFTFFGIILGWWYIYKNIGQAYKTIFPLFIENILYIYLSFLGIIKTKLRR